MVKTRLFSQRALLVSLKGFASSILSAISSSPLWVLMAYLISKDLNGLGFFFGVASGVISFLFLGFWNSRLWGWK